MPPALRFSAIFTALTAVAMAAPLFEPINHRLVQPFTELLTRFSAVAISVFGGDARAVGEQLSLARGCTVVVSNGCNALEASLLLAAAMAAWPAPIRSRLLGVAVGISLLQTVNLLRIISLLYLSCWSTNLFSFFHLYVWEGIIMIDGLLIFLGWQRWLDRANAT